MRNARRRIRVSIPDVPRPVLLTAGQLDLVCAHYSDGRLALALQGPWRTHVLRGPDASLMARRVLARLNDDVGSKTQLNDALHLVEAGIAAGEYLGVDPRRAVLQRKLGSDGSFLLSDMAPAARLALEMGLSEADEARALTGELRLLERQWKEADELARISDALTITDEVHRKVDDRS